MHQYASFSTKTVAHTNIDVEIFKTELPHFARRISFVCMSANLQSINFIYMYSSLKIRKIENMTVLKKCPVELLYNI